MDEALEGASTKFDSSRLLLRLNIPQKLLVNLPRGFVPPEALQFGDFLPFINYYGNYSHYGTRGEVTGADSDMMLWTLQSGFNIGHWQLRYDGNYTDNFDTPSAWRTNAVYAQKPLLDLQSELTVGDSYNNGQYFSGLSFRGISLRSDESMLPPSRRGYAPVVRGVADSNATVLIRQNNTIIYQTTVSPGPFEIRDISAGTINTDLVVEVRESTGPSKWFTVSYMAQANALREGMSRYSVIAGQVKDIADNDWFGEFVYSYGLNNIFTVNAGGQLADHYQGGLVGGVLSTSLGAFGTDINYTRWQLLNNQARTGWNGRLTYSKFFASTRTNININLNYYSSKDYQELNNYFNERYQNKSPLNSDYSGTVQRAYWQAMISQNMDEYGSLHFSASQQSYQTGRSSDIQYQLGYGRKIFGRANINLSIGRQYRGKDDLRILGNSSVGPRRRETYVQLSINLPVGGTQSSPYLRASTQRTSERGAIYQTALNGATQNNELTYGLGMTYDADQSARDWYGNLQKDFGLTTVGANASYGETYWQAGGTVRGGAVIHPGGITFSPYLSDTFALLEAKGAEGARVVNGQGARIGRRGYAVAPSLTPYAYNSISLDPTEMSANTELLGGDPRVAPVNGAALKIEFATQSGQALLLTVHYLKVIPMGATIIDDQGNVVGMMGQGQQAYVRVSEPSGQLLIRWGEENNEQCHADYILPDYSEDAALTILRVQCQPGGLGNE